MVLLAQAKRGCRTSSSSLGEYFLGIQTLVFNNFRVWVWMGKGELEDRNFIIN
jgi:hypothetical protein